MADTAELGDDREQYVSTLVRSGRYPSRGEILREGVRLIEKRERRLASLDAALLRGIADANAGRAKPIGAVADRLTAKYETMAKDRGA